MECYGLAREVRHRSALANQAARNSGKIPFSKRLQNRSSGSPESFVLTEPLLSSPIPSLPKLPRPLERSRSRLPIQWEDVAWQSRSTTEWWISLDTSLIKRKPVHYLF